MSSDGILPNSKSLDPFFSNAVNDGDAAETFNRSTITGGVVDPAPTDIQDFSIDKMAEDQKKAVTAIRTIGTSLPRPAAGWGYDVAYNPAPSKDGSPREFDPEFQTNPALRKAGPINFLWDEERKIWSGGLEFLGGTVDGPITPASSPTEPTEWKLKVFRKTSEVSQKGAGSLGHEGEIITCYNRDTNLQSEGGDNIWAIVIRLNYEWTPIWVSCI